MTQQKYELMCVDLILPSKLLDGPELLLNVKMPLMKIEMKAT